jgi:DNA polymerase III subunit epsilon
MFHQFRNLKLDRKVVVLDLETTGTNYKTDRIVQFAVLKIEPGDIPRVFASHVDPGVPIPPAATAVHGIRDEDVKDSLDFAYLAGELFDELDGAVLIGYNLKKFDLPLLIEEFARCGIEFSLKDRLIIDTYQIFREMQPRTLSGALDFFCGMQHEKAHQAEEDVDVTALVLDGQLGHYAELPKTLEALHERFATPDLMGKFRRVGDELCFTFGKHAGRPLGEVAATDPDYLRWMINDGDFLEDVREIVSEQLEIAMDAWDKNL